MHSILERLFALSDHNTRIPTELLTGLTTFITMAYIIFVNPQMMASAGRPRALSNARGLEPGM